MATGEANIGRWTAEEHDAFVQGLNLYGRDWKAVAALVSTLALLYTQIFSCVGAL